MGMELLTVVSLDELKKSFSGKPLIVGLPTSGLVGSVALSHLSVEFKAETLASIYSEKLAPIGAVHEREVHPPVRLLYLRGLDSLGLISEIGLPLTVSNELGRLINRLIPLLRISEVNILGGIYTGKKKSETYYIATHEELKKKANKLKVGKPLEEGAITGASGVILYLSSLYKHKTIAFFSSVEYDSLDVDAAIRVLKAYSKWIGKPIDTKELEEEKMELAKEATPAKYSPAGIYG